MTAFLLCSAVLWHLPRKVVAVQQMLGFFRAGFAQILAVQRLYRRIFVRIAEGSMPVEVIQHLAACFGLFTVAAVHRLTAAARAAAGQAMISTNSYFTSPRRIALISRRALDRRW